MPPKKKESEEDVDRLTRIAMYVQHCLLLGRKEACPPSLPTLPNFKPLQLAYVVADQVGAWRPAGQGENQPALSWPMADPDPHQVLVAGGEIEIQLRHGRAPGGAGLRYSCTLESRRRGWRHAAGPSQLRSGG